MNENEPTTEYIRWGLPLDEIEQLGQRLVLFFERFSPFFRNKTHDVSEYGFHYLSGLLRMKAKRNMAEIGRKTGVSPQNCNSH
jgi:hypothetical protein